MRCKVCGREYDNYPRYEGVCSSKCEYYYRYIISDDYWGEAHWERFMNNDVFKDFLRGQYGYWAVDRLKRFYESFSNAWKDEAPVYSKYPTITIKDKWGNYKKKEKRVQVFKMNVLEGLYYFLRLYKAEPDIQKKILMLFALNMQKNEEDALNMVNVFLEERR